MEQKDQRDMNTDDGGLPDINHIYDKMNQFMLNYKELKQSLHNDQSETLNNMKTQRLSSMNEGTFKLENNQRLRQQKGILLKYSPSWFSGWQERYFVLDNKKIKWFKNVNDKIPQGVLNFDFYKCIVQTVPGKKRCFNLTLNGNDRVFQIKAHSEDDSMEWQQAL